ncbi:MAG: LysM peptidoglycan-binding domain-containing protein [Opitutaceae bacterium]|nr:LysM peptidoglycan-binding domain-containing protein [Verrucomicrobiales bacterium]
MNNPSPLVPQGSLQQNAQGRSYVKMAFFTVVAIHIVFFGGLLFQGCKKQTADTDLAASNPSSLDPTNLTSFSPMIGSDTNLVSPTTLSNVPMGDAGLASSNLPSQPLPPVAELPPAAPATRDYIVIKGDTVERIAKKSGVTQRSITEANPGLVPTKLKIGQKIQVPASAESPTAMPLGADFGAASAAPEFTTYVVKSGDTLTRVAKVNGTTLKAVRSLNGLKTDQIKVGQKLKLPAPKAAPAPVAPEPQPLPVNTTVIPPGTANPGTPTPLIAQPVQPVRTAPPGK